MISCPTCGASNQPNSVFCSQCATNITGQGTSVRYNPHAHMPPPQTYGTYGTGFLLPSRAGTILTLGILSLVVCGILGPIAWTMGNEELRRMDAGETDPSQRGSVTAGRVCGIIASALMIFSVVIFLFMMVTITSATSRY
jgi:hypothetical protein